MKLGQVSGKEKYQAARPEGDDHKGDEDAFG
jgi:hypothetical protein